MRLHYCIHIATLPKLSVAAVVGWGLFCSITLLQVIYRVENDSGPDHADEKHEDACDDRAAEGLHALAKSRLRPPLLFFPLRCCRNRCSLGVVSHLYVMQSQPCRRVLVRLILHEDVVAEDDGEHEGDEAVHNEARPAQHVRDQLSLV
jgi:hypothetical protein